MSPDQLEKAFRFHFGEVVGNNSGVITVNGEPPTAEMLASAPEWLAQALDADRVALIKQQANERVEAITGGQEQVNKDIATVVAVLYANMRPTLSDSDRSICDPMAAKQLQAKQVRIREAQMIQDASLTW